MGWSYLRNKSLRMDFRHSLWLKIMDANLYVESCDQSPTMKSNCFLEFSPIMESGILDLEAYPPIYLYMYEIYIYIYIIIFNDILIPPPKPPHPMPHHPTQFWQRPNHPMPHHPNPNLAAAKQEFGSCQSPVWRLPSCQTRVWQLRNPRVAAAKPEFDSCQTRCRRLPSCQARVRQLPHDVGPR